MTVAYLDEPIPFQGEVHPYADRWPMRTADELEQMAASIREEGQDLPITLTPDGVLVDGRNRLRACEIANVTPTFTTRDDLVDEDSITRFIWRMNGDRRDMSKGAKAMLAALRPGTARSLSEQTGVALGYVGKALAVIEFCTDAVVAAVISDDMALNVAYEEAQRIKATVQAEEIAARKAKQAEKERKEREAKQLADLRANRPDLADLVDEGKLPLGDALSLRSKDIAKEAQRAKFKADAIKQRNLDVNAAFTTIDSLTFPGVLDEVQDNWRALSTNWTAPMLHRLADSLHQIADQWRVTQ